MYVSYNNYRRMNQLMRPEIRKELEVLLSTDSDKELFEYQIKNEKAIGKTLGKGYPVGVSSGTAALQFSLTSLGIGNGDEVLTVPNTFVATALAISNTGAQPRFVDIDNDTMLMDHRLIEDQINGRTKAIIPVHLYGQMTNMHAIKRIAKKKGLSIIEDACHAHRAKFDEKSPGHLSDAACYSFFPSKGLGGIGNGGMIITKKKYIYQKAGILRDPTADNPLLLRSLRTPAYLDWTEMAFIKCRLSYLKEWTNARRQIAECYFEELAGLPIVLPSVDNRAFHVFRNFVIRTDKRDNLHKYLRKHGIETVVHYPTPIHLMKLYSHLGYNEGDFPVSEEACNSVLSLPINQFLNRNEIQYLCRVMKMFFK